jgi:hypothetical protein
MTDEEIKAFNEAEQRIIDSCTKTITLYKKEYVEKLEKENEKLKERINKIEKHVSSLSSVGRGCEIYADVKREILKVVRGDKNEHI